MATIRAATPDSPLQFTPSGETPVEQAVRHVMEGEEHLKRQRRALSDLKAAGHPTMGAEMTLKAFEASQENHKAHLRRLVDRLEAPAASANDH